MPQIFPTPNALSLESTPEPTPGLLSPVDEDKSSNTIARENAPEDNLGLHYFSIS